MRKDSSIEAGGAVVAGVASLSSPLSSLFGWSDMPVILGPKGEGTSPAAVASQTAANVPLHRKKQQQQQHESGDNQPPVTYGWADFPVLLGDEKFAPVARCEGQSSMQCDGVDVVGNKGRVGNDLESLLLLSGGSGGGPALIQRTVSVETRGSDDDEGRFGWVDFPVVLGPYACQHGGAVISDGMENDSSPADMGDKVTMDREASTSSFHEAEMSEDDDASIICMTERDQPIRIEMDPYIRDAAAASPASGKMFGWGDFLLSLSDAAAPSCFQNSNSPALEEHTPKTNESSFASTESMHRRIPSLVETESDCFSVRSDSTYGDEDASSLHSAPSCSSMYFSGVRRTERGVVVSEERASAERSPPKVSFSNVEVREYALVLGDHPWANSYPLSLDWRHAPGKILRVDDFESRREAKFRALATSLPPRERSASGFKTPRRLTEYERRWRLLSGAASSSSLQDEDDDSQDGEDELSPSALDRLEEARRKSAEKEGIGKSYIHPPIDIMYIEELVRNSHQQRQHWSATHGLHANVTDGTATQNSTASSSSGGFLEMEMEEGGIFF